MTEATDTSADHWPYVEAVAGALRAEGLHVRDLEDSTDEYRGAVITLVTRSGAEPEDEDGWKFTRYLMWDERHGWATGRGTEGGEIGLILYWDQYVPWPRVIAAAYKALRGRDGEDPNGYARRWSRDPVAERDADADDPEFEAELAEAAAEADSEGGNG